MTDDLTPLQRFAAGTKGTRLPEGPKAVLELADGSYIVKTQVGDEVGYLHVGADWVSTGELLTLEDAARLRSH